MSLLLRAAVVSALGAAMALPVHAGIISIATSTVGKYVNLDSVTVERGGTPTTYQTAELIGFDVTAYNAGYAGAILVGDGGLFPSSGSRAKLLDTDWAVNTGLINLDNNPEADGGDPTGLRIVFTTPVVNAVGPDIVFLEVHYTAGADADNPDGVAVKVTGGSTEKSYAAADYTGRLLASNINLDLYKASSEPNTLAAIEDAGKSLDAHCDNFNVYGLAIDLSDLGVAPGATVTGLDFRSTASGKYVDPTLIAGLAPEPATLALLAAGGLGVLIRRRRP